MVIGFDFDNTIVSYDVLFKNLALERELVPEDFPANKTFIRDHLRATGREPLWTSMQGEAYGPRMREAVAFPGVKHAIARLIQSGVDVRIVSHKTRFPISGPQFDLHDAALAWLEEENFWTAAIGLRREHAFFEPTKELKLARIASERCDAFIDDLPEILLAPLFPTTVRRYLFDPEGVHAPREGLRVLSSWDEFSWP
jgi:hypothetical protein